MKELLWAAPDFAEELARELVQKKVKVRARKEHLFFVEASEHSFVWAQARASQAEELFFDSISQAQNELKTRGKLWCESSMSHFRRSELIRQGLRPLISRKRKAFETVPSGPLGVYSLVDENELWFSPELKPAVPPFSWEFEESKAAPSRAYLKLWELFTREGFAPKPGETCLELGSAPGGWTWVLANRGCPVIAVDKGEMDPKVLRMKGVKWLRKDAFAQDLQSLVGPVDWFFSDLICFPQDLLALVTQWREQKWAQNFVCTIKFKGETDSKTLSQFLEIPNSKAVHLQHNKHEVTWFCLS
ncbi:MAG: SAM-dependent methyltransferase [Bdellovibrio sp.]